MSDTKKKKFYILLTRFPDRWSRMIGVFTNSIYTHASIGLEEDMNTYYSFVWKGFIVESITRYLRPDRDPYTCELYEYEISTEQYDTMKRMLHKFADNKHIYSFARVELIFGLMKMPIITKNKYYCSQFIADVLKESKVLNTKRNSARFFPKDFGKIEGAKMIFKGDLLGYVNKYSLLPASAQ